MRLATVLRRRAIDHLRRRGVRGSQAVDRDELLFDRGKAAGDPAAAALQLERHAALIDALRALEDGDRTLLVRRYFEGIEPAEIAEQDGLRSSTVRSRLARSLTRLRDELERRHGTGPMGWVALVAPTAGLTRRGVKSCARKSVLVRVELWKPLVLAGALAAVVVIAGRAARGLERTARQAVPVPERAASAGGESNKIVSSTEGHRVVDRGLAHQDDGLWVGVDTEGTSENKPMTERRAEFSPDLTRTGELRGRVILGDGTPVPAGIDVVALEAESDESQATSSTDVDGSFVMGGPLQFPLDLVLQSKGTVVSDARVRVEAGSLELEVIANLLLVELSCEIARENSTFFRWESFGPRGHSGSTSMASLARPSAALLLPQGPGYKIELHSEKAEHYGLMEPGQPSGAYVVELRTDALGLGDLVVEASGVALAYPARVSLQLEPVEVAAGQLMPDESITIQFSDVVKTKSTERGLLPGRYRVTARVILLPGEQRPARASVHPAVIDIVAGSVATLAVKVETAAGLVVRVREPVQSAQEPSEHRVYTLETRSSEEAPWQVRSIGWRSGDDSWQTSNTFEAGISIHTGALPPGMTHIRLISREQVVYERRFVLTDGVVTPLDLVPYVEQRE